MPTLIRCHPHRRVLSRLAGRFATLCRVAAVAVTSVATAACGSADDEIHVLTASSAASTPRAAIADPGYLPRQFPDPTGAIEPLPPQF